eukprot:scaffold1334_cov344-Prasinococcus_capsulatus_cf.AAC.9
MATSGAGRADDRAAANAPPLPAASQATSTQPRNDAKQNASLVSSRLLSSRRRRCCCRRRRRRRSRSRPDKARPRSDRPHARPQRHGARPG